MALCLKPAPKTGAVAGDLLNQQINQAADGQQWETYVHQHPQHQHQRETRFFQAMSHHGLGLAAKAKAKFVQHGARILGA
ncbi:MAG: hypothetical protein RLY41_369 [Pseudomonadota bacterium]